MVTELKERQEKQVTPASREETINRLDVIEQRISEMQGKSGLTENTVREILNQIGSIGKGQSENQKQDLEDIKGLIVTSVSYTHLVRSLVVNLIVNLRIRQFPRITVSLHRPG